MRCISKYPQDRRNATYSSFDDAVSKWKTSKDSSAFANNTRRVNMKHSILVLNLLVEAYISNHLG